MTVVERNIERLKNQVETLVTVRDDLQLQVDEAEKNREIINNAVESWINRVTVVTAETERLIAAAKNGEIINSAIKSWTNRVTAIAAKARTERIIDNSEEVENDYWENWNRKLLLWKKAQGIQVVIDVLLSTRTFHRVSHPAPVVGIVSIVLTGNFEFNSQMSTVKEVMDTLRDDEINIIGICGMGGIGKTTIVKDVAIRANNENLFDEIIMAVVSHSPDLWNIQGQVAANLGFRLGKETLFGRATRLRQRLANGKRILLVLDDFWEWLDLQAIGIPFWGENKG
ncbi:putative disease resistance protein [Camellia lanceoleosa]|uniref:Disease resistance protein n=1 Tax=Camellia lanceoleosa TaxID=1840588 RepID=A0ACC0G717_9ERIC|nr:putative disease resistance protein [Camellia lanceoleosa]